MFSGSFWPIFCLSFNRVSIGTYSIVLNIRKSNKVLCNYRNGRFGGDGQNIAVLLFLYVLQGIPLGLAAAVPLILTNRQVSYKQQAEFSFAFWPFSVKLLWAPIVDALFIKRFGRRKTWLVPVQYSIGITMLLLAQNVDYYLDQTPNPDVFRYVWNILVYDLFKIHALKYWR